MNDLNIVAVTGLTLTGAFAAAVALSPKALLWIAAWAQGRAAYLRHMEEERARGKELAAGVRLAAAKEFGLEAE